MKILRAALYERVSTEEQALHGDSLPAQEEALTAYAADNNLRIVDIYRDEGNSARKPALKRPVMLKLLEDVEADKIDIIIFTKLDRWFRNIREYYKVQAILEEHNVVWKAILEQYDTSTADGRLKVNIMLSVAENEADRTSERIKFVFDSKRKRKETTFRSDNPPYGYMVQKIDGVRRLVKNPETESHMQDFWDHLVKYNSVRLAGLYVNEKYGLDRRYKSWMGNARNELYTGTYRGVEDFCPAYVSHQDWEYIQQSHVLVKKTQRPERVYLFTGLLRCPVCGGTLKGTFKTYPKDRNIEYKSYRCNNGRLGICTYRGSLSQKKVEKYLLQNVKTELEQYIIDVEVKQAERKPTAAADIVKLNEQIRRLNKIYMAGNMDDDEYTKKTTELKLKIEKARQAEQSERPPDLEVLKQFLKSDFETIYQTLAEEDKRYLWRSIISEIYVEGCRPIGIKFRA